MPPKGKTPMNPEQAKLGGELLQAGKRAREKDPELAAALYKLGGRQVGEAMHHDNPQNTYSHSTSGWFGSNSLFGGAGGIAETCGIFGVMAKVEAARGASGGAFRSSSSSSVGMGGSFPSCSAGADSSYRAGADPAFEEWATRQGYSHLLPSPDSELPTRVAMPVQDSELPTRVAMPVHGERVQVGGLFGDDSNCNGQNGIIVEWSNDRGTVRIETGYSGQVGRVVHVQQTNLYPYGQTVNLYPYGQTVDMTSGILLEQSTGARPPAAAAATSLPPSAASSGKASKAKITSSYEPPPPVQMRSRLCALNFDLIRDMKAKFHNRPIPAGEITKWFKSNPQQLDGTGISIDQISTDHIIPKSVGGYDHLFNYYIMPKGHNSHFKDNWTPEKQAYVGKQGVKIAQGFSQWCKDKATPDLQFFNFKPDNYLL